VNERDLPPDGFVVRALISHLGQAFAFFIKKGDIFMLAHGSSLQDDEYDGDIAYGGQDEVAIVSFSPRCGEGSNYYELIRLSVEKRFRWRRLCMR
jgi:hypothetical protein